VTYFAAGLARTTGGWTGRELDLSEAEDLDALAEQLRDLTGDEDGPVLMLFEEDDEYLAVVRVEGGGSMAEPRVFLSDVRAVQASGVAAMLWEAAEVVEDLDDEDEDDDDEDEGTRAVSEPIGDSALLADLGTPEGDLLALCAEEGLLPADVLVAIAERAGFSDVLDELRPI
jgi:putative tRNA adenosine deaminase-associated protein